MSSLTVDERKTLKGMPTLSDETSYCPLYFEYTKDGKHMAASAMDDIIHGTKIFYEDLDRYANAKRKNESPNSPLHTDAARQ